MIIMSNNDKNSEVSLAEQMRKRSLANSSQKLFNIKEDFKRRVEIESNHGNTNMVYIIMEKAGSVYMTKEMINLFSDFIVDDCRFKLKYDFIDDGKGEPFHSFRIQW